jgi:hypothetical protein
MKSLLFSIFLLASMLTRAQLSNVVVYSEAGERFSLALNGVIQNNLPGNNVRLTGVLPGSYNMSMIFEIQALGAVNWNLIVEPSSEATFCARRLPGGEWMVRLMSIVPMVQAVGTILPNQAVVVYHASPLPGATTTTTTTTTYYDDPLYNDNININMGINGGGFNMNIGGNYSETTTTQSTYVNPGYQQTIVQSPGYTNQVLPAQPMQPAYPAPVGCSFAMDPASFADARNSISSKGFESTRLQVAQQITQARCLTASQVRDIMRLFSFESTKLEFAKFAFPYTFDTNNYFMVNDAFGFSSSIDDLNRYLNGRR